jgi:hypothetical protein
MIRLLKWGGDNALWWIAVHAPKKLKYYIFMLELAERTMLYQMVQTPEQTVEEILTSDGVIRQW